MAVKLFAVRLAPHGIPVFELTPRHHHHRHDGERKDVYDRRIADGLVPEGR